MKRKRRGEARNNRRISYTGFFVWKVLLIKQLQIYIRINVFYHFILFWSDSPQHSSICVYVHTVLVSSLLLPSLYLLVKFRVPFASVAFEWVPESGSSKVFAGLESHTASERSCNGLVSAVRGEKFAYCVWTEMIWPTPISWKGYRILKRWTSWNTWTSTTELGTNCLSSRH